MRILIFDSIKAGILIGFGCIAFVLVPNHILGSFLFSLGLLTVCIKQLTLYTGKIGSFGYLYTPKFNHGTNYFCDTKDLTVMLIFNLIGITLLCGLFRTYSGFDLSVATDIIANKAKLDWVECFTRAIGCGAMMEIAVSGWKKTQNYLAVIMPVMCFILCGFEHCIADMGYMALAGDCYPFFILVAIAGNSIGSWLISKI